MLPGVCRHICPRTVFSEEVTQEQNLKAVMSEVCPAQETAAGLATGPTQGGGYPVEERFFVAV